MGSAEPSRGFRRAALGAAVSVWALVVLGGIVRVTESGLGCPDWPLCDGRVVPVRQREAWIETSHRWLAGLASVLVLLVAIWAWRRYRERRDVLLPAVTAVVLIPVQALLGAVVVWLEVPGPVVGVHFVLGMLFLAAAALTAAAAWRDGGAPTPRFVGLAWAAGLAGLVVVSLGAAVVAADAAYACGTTWPGCDGTFASGGGEAWLHQAHRIASYLLAALALALAVLARRGEGPRALGSVPLVAALCQIAIGVSLVLALGGAGAVDWLAAVHVAGAATVWASLVALSGYVGFPRRRFHPPAAVTTGAR